jgi:outer membrane cobalamin receptor
LSESFETNNTVDAVTTDAITGSRKIEMLGLAGIYTQVLRENLPQMRGLITNAGFGQVPGTWIESIQLSKGVGSVVNGFESIAGQINLELKMPDSEEKLHLNGYINQMGRNEVNFFKTYKLSDKVQTAILAHGDYMQRDWDRNGDGFMDNPDSKQLNIENRWKFSNGKNLRAHVGVHVLQDEKVSGTTNAHNQETQEHAWNFKNKVFRADAYGKMGIVFPDKPYKSLAFLGNAFYYAQNSTLDTRLYDATQKSAYLSGIFQNWIGENDTHSFRTGFNVQYDNFEEYFTGNPFNREELVSGVFFEYMLRKGRSTLIAGLRGDYNSLFGAFATPRLHYKYMITDETAFRLSGGRGQRTANVIEENIGYFASSRQLKIIPSTTDANSGFRLLPEIGWNGGGGITHNYSIGTRSGSLSADAYYTWFERQTVLDLDASPQEVLFYNQRGNSFALSSQIDWNQEINRRLDIRMSYKYTDAQTLYTSGWLARPFLAAHRALANIAFHSRGDKWLADLTVNYISEKRLPDSRSNPLEFQMRERSPDFALVNAQITRNLKNWAVYAGVENLLDFRQKRQIVSPSDPHSQFFDGSYIWGPTFGRVIYVGFRWVLTEK